jgi:hypothetical protein
VGSIKESPRGMLSCQVFNGSYVISINSKIARAGPG